MTTSKIAVSLPPQAVARARAAVKSGRAPSVSAYVADALEQKARNEDLREMLDRLLAESGGPLTKAERHEADVLLGHDVSSARSKGRSKRSIAKRSRR